MSERVAVVLGVRTPFCKAAGVLRGLEAEDLGAYVVKEILARASIDPEEVSELIFGNVIQNPHATNVARVLAVKGGLPIKVPAFTVNRNCASGLEAITTGMVTILEKEADIVLAGGSESMSNVPILFGKKMRDLLFRFTKAKSMKDRFKVLLGFRPGYLAPEIPAIADPICGLTMGETAEILSREFKITREEQDAFALRSQNNAEKAREKGIFAEEIIPVPVPPKYETMQLDDDGIREGQTLEALGKLRTVFDKLTGTVTAGNSSQVTDGAAAVLLMKESEAKKRGIEPLGYIKEYAYAALEPSRMGLGPVFAVSKLLEKTGMELKDFDLIEINEAFAAQVIACERAFSSDTFAAKELGRSRAIGELDRDRLNVNGGAIALGHPVGASGARLVLTLLKELRRRNQNTGLATLCVGGGQGEAVVVEVV